MTPNPISIRMISNMKDPNVCIIHGFFVQAPQHPKNDMSATMTPMIMIKIDVFTNPVSPRKSK